MLKELISERNTTMVVRVEVLHHFRIVVHGAYVEVPDSGARLVALLALDDCPRLRPSLANTLWPDRSETDARTSLRRSLWRLNEAAPGVIVRIGHQLALAGHVSVDAREVVALAERLDNGQPVPSRIGPDLVRLLQGDLLPHWSDDWLDGFREWMRQLRLHTLEALARGALDADRPGAALTIALAAVGIDPLRESARRIVIAAHLVEGNSADALRHYYQYRDLLWDEIGLQPSRYLQGVVADGCGPIARLGSKSRRAPRTANFQHPPPKRGT